MAARSAEAILRERRRARRLLEREHLALRAAPGVRRALRRVVPMLLTREGPLELYYETGPAEEIVRRLGAEAVWTLDSATRARWRISLLAAHTDFAYLRSPGPLRSCVANGLLAGPLAEGPLAPPYPVGPRLFCVLVDELPPARSTPDGMLVVDDDRLLADMLGALGSRPDLLAPVLERLGRLPPPR